MIRWRELVGAGDLVVGVNRPIQNDGDINVESVRATRRACDPNG